MVNKVTKGKTPTKKAREEWDDFGDDDLEGLDGLDFSDELGSNSRAPAKAGIGKEFLSGSKEGFRKDILKNLGKKSLPQEFETYSGEISDLSSFASETLDRSKSKLKKPIARIAKDVKKFLPESFTKINKLVDKVIDSTDEYKSQQINEEAARTTQITGELSNIFDKNIEVQKALAAQSDAQADTDRKITLTNAKKTQDILTDISASSATQTSFSLQIAKEYYKKSLELQFRSYYVQADMLRSIKEHYPVFKTQFDGILKNTGLPDFVKIKLDEKYFDIARTQMLEKINTDIFTNSSFLKNMKKNLSSAIDSKVNTMTSALEGIADALSGINDLSEMDQSKTKVGTAGNLAGSLAGSTLAEKMGGWIGDKIRPHMEKSKTVNIAKNAIAAYATSPQSFLANLKDMLSGKKEDFEKELANNPKAGLFKKMKNKVGSMLAGAGEEVVGLTGKTTFDKDVNKQSILTSKTPAVFDQLVHRSITHVIPTYLSHILNENKRLTKHFVTAKDEGKDLMLYDYNERKLSTAENVRTSYGAFLKKNSGDDKANQAATGIVNNLKIMNQSQDDKKKSVESLKDYISQVTSSVGSEKVNYENLFGDTQDPAILAIRKSVPGIEATIKEMKKQSEKSNVVKERLEESVKQVTTSSAAKEIMEFFKLVEGVAAGLNLDVKTSGAGTTDFDINLSEAIAIEFSLTRYIIDEANALTVKRLPDAFKFVSDPELLVQKVMLLISVVKTSTTFSEYRYNYNAQISRSLAAINTRILAGIRLDPELVRSIFNITPEIFEYDKITSDALINMRLGVKDEINKKKKSNFNELMANETPMGISDSIKASLTFKTTEQFAGDKLREIYDKTKVSANKVNQTIRKISDVAKEIKNAKGDKNKQAAILKAALDEATSAMNSASRAVMDKVDNGIKSLENLTVKITSKGVVEITKQIDKNLADLEELLKEKELEKEGTAQIENLLNTRLQENIGGNVEIKSYRKEFLDLEIKMIKKSMTQLSNVKKRLERIVATEKKGEKSKQAIKDMYERIRAAFVNSLIQFKEMNIKFQEESARLKQLSEAAAMATNTSITQAEAAAAGAGTPPTSA